MVQIVCIQSLRMLGLEEDASGTQQTSRVAISCTIDPMRYALHSIQ